MRTIEWADKSFSFSFPEFADWPVREIISKSPTTAIINFSRNSLGNDKSVAQIIVKKMRYPCLASQRIFDEQLAVAKLKLCQSRIVLETNLTVFFAFDPSSHAIGYSPGLDEWEVMLIVLPLFSVMISRFPFKDTSFDINYFLQTIVSTLKSD